MYDGVVHLACYKYHLNYVHTTFLRSNMVHSENMLVSLL